MNKFEKVSFEQFEKDFRKLYTMCNEEGNKIEIPVEEIRNYYDNITLPKRSTKNSAGYDFVMPIPLYLESGKDVVIPTGIKCQLDEDKVLQIYPRSSFGFIYKLKLDNTVGIIDADYYNNENNEGHILIKMTNDWLNDKDMVLAPGDRIVQGVITQFFKVEDDEVSEERVGGIGSTNSIELVEEDETEEEE